MDKYIGCKLVEAEEMKLDEFNFIFKHLETDKDTEGYKIVYSDGYTSWCPKEVFEKSYLKLDPNSDLKTDVSISQSMVDSFIKDIKVSTIGDKTTLVTATLVNGFEIHGLSSCVDKENYDEEVGRKICLAKIMDQVWNLLGFLLQSAVGGLK